MHPLIENNREAIARLCRLHSVRSLEAFGSIPRNRRLRYYIEQSKSSIYAAA